jgi:hypothetical protein
LAALRLRLRSGSRSRSFDNRRLALRGLNRSLFPQRAAAAHFGRDAWG